MFCATNISGAVMKMKYPQVLKNCTYCICTLWQSKMAMEHRPFMDDFHIHTFIQSNVCLRLYKGLYIAKFDLPKGNT